jgi:hypothetical protein
MAIIPVEAIVPGAHSNAEPETRSPPCVPGDIIQDKYRVEQLVGSGGMAWVFEATHLQLQNRVALKILRVETTSDNTEALARFRREARAAASIAGEATARVMDVGSLDDGSPFLVMELLEGRDLDSVIQARPHLSITTAVNYVLQACEGLAETHAAGIVHRDLKPSNLFLTQTSDGSVRVKLIDFGVSKIDGPSDDGARMTATRGLIGSPIYMSPEQMRSNRGIDGRTDIWSMGVILYELLAGGRSPFEGPTLPLICARVLDGEPPPLRKIRSEIPRALEAVVLMCLEKDPDRRFQTVADLAMALVRFGPIDAHARAHRIARILYGGRLGRRSGVGAKAPSAWLLAGAVTAAALLALAVVLLYRPSYVESTVSAARAWAASAPLRVEVTPAIHTSAAPTGLEPPLPPPPLSTFASPEVAAPEPAATTSPPSASSVTAPPEPDQAEAMASGPGAAKAQRTRAPRRPPLAQRSSKRFVFEPVPSPNPAPPIMVPPVEQAPVPAPAPPVMPPIEVEVPDLGSRE